MATGAEILAARHGPRIMDVMAGAAFHLGVVRTFQLRRNCLTAGKTALIITHRFTTAMHADIIHVMDKGRIVESGTHDELVAMEGAYAASWAAQMREIKHA